MPQPTEKELRRRKTIVIKEIEKYAYFKGKSSSHLDKAIILISKYRAGLGEEDAKQFGNTLSFYLYGIAYVAYKKLDSGKLPEIKKTLNEIEKITRCESYQGDMDKLMQGTQSSAPEK